MSASERDGVELGGDNEDAVGSPAGLGNLLGAYTSEDEQECRGAEKASGTRAIDATEATEAPAATAPAAKATRAEAAPPPPLPPPSSDNHLDDPNWIPPSLALPADHPAPDPSLCSRVTRMLEASASTGRLLSSELRRSRAYRNPYFLEKMIDHLGLDPRASRMMPPPGYEGSGRGDEGDGDGGVVIPPEDTADALEAEEAAARRAASSAVTGRVEFVKGRRRWD